VQRAAALYQAGRLDEARTRALEVLAADPRDFNALHLLAAIAVRAQRAEEAIDFATRALAVVPGHPEALCNRGIALRALDRVEDALADYDRVLAADPRHVAALSLRGVALAALNRHGDAIDSFSRAITLEPRYAPAYLNRAFSKLVTGRYEEGWRDFEWRWTGSDTQIPLRKFPQPEWRGEGPARALDPRACGAGPGRCHPVRALRAASRGARCASRPRGAGAVDGTIRRTSRPARDHRRGASPPPTSSARC
jgi:Flp pilus assembly protein TadD